MVVQFFDSVVHIPVMRAVTCTHSAYYADDCRVSTGAVLGTVPPPDIGGVGFGSSPNLDTYHTFYELSLPSERGCPDSAALRAARVFAPLCRVMVGGFLSRWCLRFYLGTVLCRLLEKYIVFFFPVPRGRWGVCLLILVQQQRRDLR